MLYGRSTGFYVKGLRIGVFDFDDEGSERVCVGADRGVGRRWGMRRGGMGGWRGRGELGGGLQGAVRRAPHGQKSQHSTLELSGCNFVSIGVLKKSPL